LIKYLITDPKYYTNDKILFEKKLTTCLKQKIDIACFRDKTSNNIEELAKIFISTCEKEKIDKYLINTNISLAKKLNATGVHLNSTQFDEISKAKSLGLYVIISCHNEEEIKKAIKEKADAITYSPIFFTPNKGEPKGVENLKNIVLKYNQINIIALGGIIDNNEVDQIKNTKAYGFASIRYFI
jgi:thiamine-phosphate pyrophosphorylase